MQRWLPCLATALATLLAIVCLRNWLRVETPRPEVRAPTAKGSIAESNAVEVLNKWHAEEIRNAKTNLLIGTFQAFPGAVAPTQSADWPGFRGPLRENIADDNVPLAESWPAGGPPILWQMSLGNGHAAPAVHHGRVYLLDYDEVRDGDVLRCFALDSGREIWQRFYTGKVRNPHGFSRTIPAVTDDCIVSLGPDGQLLCVTTTNGAFRWGMDIKQVFGLKQSPTWGMGQCPLIDKGEVVLAPAGKLALLAGVDLVTGKTNWITPNSSNLTMSHSSVMVLNAEGGRQFLYAALGGISGVAADGPQRGQLLWQTKWMIPATKPFTPSVIAPSPVPLPDGRFFMTAGYKAGGTMFRVARSNNTWQAEVLFNTNCRVFACEQQTPILHGDLLFAILPNEGDHRQEFSCMTTDGSTLWYSGTTLRFGGRQDGGLGPLLGVGKDRFLLLNDASGDLSFMRADRAGCQLLATASFMGGAKEGHDAWGPMALVDGRLLLRDVHRLYCLDLRKK